MKALRIEHDWGSLQPWQPSLNGVPKGGEWSETSKGGEIEVFGVVEVQKVEGSPRAKIDVAKMGKSHDCLQVDEDGY